MAKIPWFVIVIVGVVLIVGISAFFWFLPVGKARQAVRASHAQLADLTAKGEQLAAAEADLDRARLDAAAAETKLEQITAQRSKRISELWPLEGSMALWAEYTRDLPALIPKFVQASGCRLINASALPPPPMTLLDVPDSGFLQIPSGSAISLTLEGRLSDIERFYRSLRNFPRIVTVNGLSLTGAGERVTANVSMNVYLMVESAPPPVAPDAEEAGMGMGMGMGMGGGMPGMTGAGMPGMAGADGKAPTGDENGEGSGLPKMGKSARQVEADTE